MTQQELNQTEVSDVEETEELKPGTPLLHGQYIIEDYLNSGGFGITYLAKDSLHRRVVIKECFPSAFCRRSEAVVGVRSRAHRNEFRSIVKLFVQEARSLAKLRHPNIVGVHQVFEDNDTAYMALDYVEGRDLLDIAEDPTVQLDPKVMTQMLRKILDAVHFVHDAGVLHRDISPDNILVDKDWNPVLIDFGAARETASKASRVLTAMRVVKDGYSPQEFYLSGTEQYPSSDLYALGASLYHVLAGDVPPNSQERLAAIAGNHPDPYQPLGTRVRGYDEAFTTAVDKALKIFPKDRLQSARDWLDILETAGAAKGATAAPRPMRVEAKISELVRDTNKDLDVAEKVTPKKPASAAPAAAKTAAAPASVKPAAPATRPIATPQAAPAQKSKTPLLLASVAVIAIVAGGAAFMMTGGEDAPATDVAAAAPTQTTTPEVAAAPTSPVAEPEFMRAARPAPVDTAPAETAELAPAEVAPAPVQAPAPVVETPALAEAPSPDVGTTSVTRPDEAPVVTAALDPDLRPAPRPEIATPVMEAAPEPVLSDTPPSVAEDINGPAVAESIASLDAVLPNAQDAGPARFLTLLQPATQGVTPSVETAAPAPMPTGPEIIDVANFISGVSVDVPFSIGADGRVQAVSTDPAWSWLATGQRIDSINGVSIASDADVQRALKANTNLTLGEPLTVPLQLAGIDSTLDVTFKTTYDVVLLNGDAFQSREQDGTWVTRVTQASGQSDDALQAGDTLIALMPAGEPINGPDTLARLLDREIADGRGVFNFAVDRGGDMYLVSMRYNVGLGQ